MLCPVLVDIYLSAMHYSPTYRDRNIQSWRRDSTRPGFSALCAIEDDYVIAMAYGFLGTREHWWYRQLERGISAIPSSSTIDDHAVRHQILGDYFEVAELHVSPLRQSQGIGRRLLEELLHLAPASYALLSTLEVENEANAAFSLYRSMGFHDFLRNYHFTGDSRPFAVLYKSLEAGEH